MLMRDHPLVVHLAVANRSAPPHAEFLPVGLGSAYMVEAMGEGHVTIGRYPQVMHLESDGRCRWKAMRRSHASLRMENFASFPMNAQDLPVSATIAPEPQASPDPQVPVAAAGDPLYAPVATSRTPQSVHERFMDYAIVIVGPRTLFIPAFLAAVRMANPPSAYPCDWRLGAGAFGRNFGSTLAPLASMETGRFLTGAFLHEDFRYRLSTSKNPLARSFHALAFTFVDKSDSGHNRIALANFVGAEASGFVGNLYLPKGFNNFSRAETRTAVAFGGFATQNLLREFVPALLKAMRRWHTPFPRIPVPEWWVKLSPH